MAIVIIAVKEPQKPHVEGSGVLWMYEDI